MHPKYRVAVGTGAAKRITNVQHVAGPNSGVIT
jgi:hypothetical protein